MDNSIAALDWLRLEKEERRVRIVSTGKPYEAAVYDADTGQMIEGITELHFSLDAVIGGRCSLTFELDVPVVPVGFEIDYMRTEGLYILKKAKPAE